MNRIKEVSVEFKDNISDSFLKYLADTYAV